MIKENDRVLLLDPRGKKYLITVSNKVFHTNIGKLELSELIGKSYGDKIKSHMGKNFSILKPNMIDFIYMMKKMPQTINPDDACQIIANTGISGGDTVVEAGAGSGAVTLLLSYTVYPGKVYSYDINERFLKVAKDNIDTYGKGNVEFKLKDIYEGIDEKDVDLVSLDLPEPYKVVGHAYEALKSGGFIFSFSPCIEQVIEFRRELTKYDYSEIKTIESIIREYEVKEKGTRPKTRMLGHTGYLSFARKA